LEGKANRWICDTSRSFHRLKTSHDRLKSIADFFLLFFRQVCPQRYQIRKLIYQEVDKAAKKEARFLKKQKKEAKKERQWTFLCMSPAWTFANVRYPPDDHNEWNANALGPCLAA
jgi:hypothetical protein